MPGQACSGSSQLPASEGCLQLAGLWDELIGFKQAVGLMAQGQQRGLDATGKVFPFKEPSPHLLVCICPCSHTSERVEPPALPRRTPCRSQSYTQYLGLT